MAFGLALAVLVAVSRPMCAGASESEQAAVQHVKSLDVAALDQSLPSQPLGAWFAQAVGLAEGSIEWSHIACGQAKSRKVGTPLCVRLQARRPVGRAAIVAAADVRVGAVGGAVEKAEMYGIEVFVLPSESRSNAEFDAILEGYRGKYLAELPALVSKAITHARDAQKRSP